jgi:hypothetical protein
VDLEPSFLEIARAKVPTGRFVVDNKVCRMSVSAQEGRDAIMPFHYLVATRGGVTSRVSRKRS